LSEISLAVLGAGVIGASTALALQADGHEVTLIDREAPCAGASFGNAGVVVNASCPPTAMPGIVSSALRMLGQPLAPLKIQPAYLHKILPWLIRFVLESRHSSVTANARSLHTLTNRSITGWRKLTDGTDLTDFLREGGWLKVYGSDRSFDATRYTRELMDANNVPYETLSAAEILDLEPNLAPIYERGIFQRDSLWVSNPQKMVQKMVDLLVSKGDTFRQFDARTIDSSGEQIMVHSQGDTLSADKVVIAAGAWSKVLCRQIGNNPPLDTERGYHLMLPASNSRLLSRPVVDSDSSFVLTPMDTGLRLCSQIEFAGLDAAPDYRYIRRLVPLARRMLPGIDTTEESVWMGCRPSLPDSLPIIGYAKDSKNVLYAFGHQHLGLTLGPATGLIVADLVAGRDPGIDLMPYRPERY